MVRGWGGGVAPVVSSYNKHVASLQKSDDFRKPFIRILKGHCITPCIVSVTVEHVKVNEVGKYQTFIHALQRIYGFINAVHVIFCMYLVCESAVAVYVAYLANASGNPAYFIKPFNRHYLLMRCNLEDAVRRCVYNRPSCLYVLFTQLLYNLCA